MLISLIFTVLRVASIASGNNDQLTLKVGSQQGALLDLRQSLRISPYLYGVNVFPPAGSSSIEANFTGFMNYGSTVVNSLHSAGINLLRFPGGSWGENHILSYDQLYDFSNLLYTTGAQGMIQARLSNPIDKYNKATTLDDRARLAGHWVDFMSNPKSTFRGKYARVPIHPVLLWSVGNEPDRGTYTLDTASKPHGMTITGTEGPNNGKAYPATTSKTSSPTPSRCTRTIPPSKSLDRKLASSTA